MASGAAGRSFPLSVVIEAVDKITSPLRKITSSITGVGAKVAGLGGSIRDLSDKSGLPILTNAFANVGKSAFGLAKTVAGIGVGVVAAAGVGVAALVPFAEKFADATGAIGDLAERTGASRERIQELGYAAQLSGSSAETLAGALQKMNIVIGEAKGGSKELQQMFRGLNISFKNASGTAKSTDEIFDMMVNRISRIKDPALQAKAAITIFGKSATELLPLLKGGTAGLAETTAEARRLGVVLSEQAVNGGEAFGDVLDKLKYALTGVGNTIGTALAPTLSQLGTALTDSIVKYRPEIEKFAKSFADNLPDYIEKARQAVVDFRDGLEPVSKALGWVSDNLGLGNAALGLFAVTIAAIVIPPVVALTGALFTLGAAMLATPIGWFIIAGAALAAIAYTIYKNWDSFASFFTERFEKVRKAFKSGIIDGIVEMWKQFNPAGLIIDSINSVIKFITGIDIAALVKGKVSGLFKSTEPQPDPVRPIGVLTREANPDPEYSAVPEGGRIASGLQAAKAAITVDFKNLPQGTQVDSQTSSGANIKTNQGYSMMPGYGQ